MIKKPRPADDASAGAPQRSYRYFELVMAGFVTVYILSLIHI